MLSLDHKHNSLISRIPLITNLISTISLPHDIIGLYKEKIAASLRVEGYRTMVRILQKMNDMRLTAQHVCVAGNLIVMIRDVLQISSKDFKFIHILV